MAFRKTTAKDDEIKFEVLEDYGVISTNGEWETRLRLVSWNGKPEKYDIRGWKGDRCGKGITLTSDEIEKLTDILVEIKNSLLTYGGVGNYN